MNKSSSFYSERYYEKARKLAKFKKLPYRQVTKQLYDQEPEIEAINVKITHDGKCELKEYFYYLNQLFEKLKRITVKGSEQYAQTIKQFIAKFRQRQYQFKIRYIVQQKNDDKKSEYQVQIFPKKIKLEQEYKPDNQSQHPKEKLLSCCHLCPIFIEQFDFNFDRTQKLIVKQNSYWDKLNGNQKLSKYRKMLQQIMNILKVQLETKCVYSPYRNQLKGARKRMNV